MDSKPSAIVVGAGLSGLSAAYRLQREGWSVVVLESEPVAGGRIRTLRDQGYVVDLGATSAGAGHEDFLALAQELELKMVTSPPWLGIARGDVVHELRVDQLVRSGVSTRLLSTRSKLQMSRLALDLVTAKLRGRLDYTDLSKAAPIDTETAHTYALRALNSEIDSYVVAPLTRTMMIADSDRTSKVELFSGIANSLGGEWQSLAGGAASIVDALVSRLDVRLRHSAEQVTELADGVRVVYTEADGRRSDLVADACVVACPLPAAAAICPERGEALNPLAAALPYTRTISVALGTTWRPDCRAFMVLLSPADSSEVAVFFQDHRKDPARAPAGNGLFTMYFEMDAAEKYFDAADDEIIECAVRALSRLWPELRASVNFTHVHRWAQALPHSQVGTFQRIAEFNAALDPADRIQFAADYMSEIGLNTAVVFGKRAAANLHSRFGGS
ncbi:protoporphyrinogen/coproporphyrinogen oxidase [Mycolicibacterium mucogenicum]|nr:NAD(P)/FAD-dependent oxidoreductase [Mycolicibacterium mucogenicum]